MRDHSTVTKGTFQCRLSIAVGVSVEAPIEILGHHGDGVVGGVYQVNHQKEFWLIR